MHARKSEVIRPCIFLVLTTGLMCSEMGRRTVIAEP
jgi:hypothetical protein